MRRMVLRFLSLILLLLASEANAQRYQTEAGEVVFLSTAALNEFTGESSQLNGLLDLESGLIDFYIDLNTLDTGIGLRDRHMRDNYLETKKYPFAEFSGNLEKSGPLELNEPLEVQARGTFTLHGKEKSMTITGTLTQLSASEILLETGFEVVLGDFDIEIPKLMFYELSETQTVTIQARLKKTDL
ncbi:Polyisoprenoid-binding protein YceI [Cyclobacterium xiamenense]|uniref:Polyisoprenoid-binding protein YceI n=1 Tax=Cyclobacterium xiamenense TaxID=1297121 RepID=A0A1H6ZUB3_9BACT|nr:YceI family protein [Cyclobacterium xiamenense]SEJ56818.1 Polyisoprenoid-binding protein YceI [Cyclobacterium xiamenense]